MSESNGPSTRTHAATEMVIAATKLHAPALRSGHVPRPELVAALAESAAGKLTLVDAPAGFGKTMLLAEWRESPGWTQRFGWLSLDEADNDPARFWTAVIEALRTVEPAIGHDAEIALKTRRVPLTELAVPLLINELASLPERVVLALDDYHAITEAEVHESLAFLLDHMPDKLHIALATRSDPPLPLSRLRARGEMSEVRAGRLRFSDAEAAALLKEALSIDLDAADVARLQERTEGWAAGLYLAALTLRGRSDASAFIAAFAGDDRQIVDYLVAEVLADQPEEMRDFLLRTSVFDRMCGSLCDAVLDSSDSTARLERIERSNLFLVPLDTTREWYRYHHLFRDLLRHELERTRPELVPDLHQRAAAWHRNAGFVPEAIRHAVSAGEIAEAVELIAAHWSEPFNEGELETVKGWLDSLPRNAVAADPRLCVAEAWLAMDKGRLDAARDWAARAEAGLAGADEAPAMAADAAVLRAVHRFKTGAVGESESAARQVLELEPEQDSFAESVAHLILGVTLYWTDRSVEAARELTHAAGSAERTGNDLGRSYALGYLAVIHADGGDLDRAEELAGTATAAGDDPGFLEHFVPMIGHLASGTVEEARGNLAEAERHLRRAVELSGRGAGRVEMAAARLALSKVRHALGDLAEARRLAREARLELEKCPDPGVLAGRLEPFERVLRAGRAQRTRNGESDAITDRELAVLRLLSSDLSLREIGDALYVSLNTVKTHTRGLYRKLSSSGRREAVERARERGLL